MNPDQEYIKGLKQIEFQPVFILGVHRSGTSILYKMLTATGCFNPVTAYHLIKYHELLSNHHLKREEQAQQKLTESFVNKGLNDRGIDRLKITADFAEEYGFLLNTQTVQMCITKKNVKLFIELCKKIKYIAQNDKPILLKNPYDFPNFLYIKQLFPNAKFVFIHRHPIKTISSTLSALHVIFQKKNPYTARLAKWYNRIVDNPLLLALYRLCFTRIPVFGVIYITRTTKKYTDYFLNNIEKLSKEDYISITYEEFCAAPQKTLERIMEKLSLPLSPSIDVSPLMKPRDAPVCPSVRKLNRYIFWSMRTYCETVQYTRNDT